MRDKDLTTVTEADQSAVALAKADPASSLELPPSSPARRDQSSHPDIESHANSMKTIAKTFFNRHTFDYPIRIVVLSDQRESKGTTFCALLTWWKGGASAPP
jgi:hypothetical protein